MEGLAEGRGKSMLSELAELIQDPHYQVPPPPPTPCTAVTDPGASDSGRLSVWGFSASLASGLCRRASSAPAFRASAAG